MDIFFENIENGIPINFDSYIKKFKKNGFDISNMFSASLHKKPYYILTPKNNKEFMKLKNLFNLKIDKNTRIGSAIRGDSHKSKCSYSFLILKEQIDSKVKTVFFENNSIVDTEDLRLKDKLIIIENLENFGNIINNFKNINIELNEYSFIYGAGKQINNHYHREFFNGFKEILCLFDIDYDGLEMYDLLSVNHNNCLFLYPENISEYLSKSLRFILKEELFKLNLRFRKNEKLHKILKEINKSQKYLEQELYLGDI